jgi:5-enolpyruvylshikimate-3-phosphate synthase
MAMSLISTKFDVEINDAEAVSKSYPHYFKELEKVGVKIDYETR